MTDICIIATGMASSLGHDVKTSCAAARAGVSRAIELDYFQFKSEEDGGLEKLKGHPIPLASRGFEGLSRMFALSRLALIDLFENHCREVFDPQLTGIYLAVPDFGRIHKGLDLISDENIRYDWQSAADNQPARAIATSDWSALVEKLFLSVQKPFDAGRLFLFSKGHCGFSAALQSAVSALIKNEVTFALIGGIDSLLEEDTLRWLLNTNRLKSDGIAAGLQPGEASVFMLLVCKDAIDDKTTNIMGRIDAIGDAEEPSDLLSGRPATGRGLEQAILGSMRSSERQVQPPFWFIADINGELYRAHDWGSAVNRLAAQVPEISDTVMWYPAMSFGDTGSASGFIAACMALTGFARGYAPSESAMILSASEGACRSCVRITKKVS